MDLCCLYVEVFTIDCVPYSYLLNQNVKRGSVSSMQLKTAKSEGCCCGCFQRYLSDKFVGDVDAPRVGIGQQELLDRVPLLTPHVAQDVRGDVACKSVQDRLLLFLDDTRRNQKREAINLTFVPDSGNSRPYTSWRRRETKACSCSYSGSTSSHSAATYDSNPSVSYHDRQ